MDGWMGWMGLGGFELFGLPVGLGIYHGWEGRELWNISGVGELESVPLAGGADGLCVFGR